MDLGIRSPFLDFFRRGEVGKDVRLLAARGDVELVAVVDPTEESRGRVAAAHGVRPLADPRDLLGLVEAAVIAAPTRPAITKDVSTGPISRVIETPTRAAT